MMTETAWPTTRLAPLFLHQKKLQIATLKPHLATSPHYGPPRPDKLPKVSIDAPKANHIAIEF
jgi:hypothetical protein